VACLQSRSSCLIHLRQYVDSYFRVHVLVRILIERTVTLVRHYEETVSTYMITTFRVRELEGFGAICMADSTELTATN
jgi:hypothetical protein